MSHEPSVASPVKGIQDRIRIQFRMFLLWFVFPNIKSVSRQAGRYRQHQCLMRLDPVSGSFEGDIHIFSGTPRQKNAMISHANSAKTVLLGTDASATQGVAMARTVSRSPCHRLLVGHEHRWLPPDGHPPNSDTTFADEPLPWSRPLKPRNLCKSLSCHPPRFASALLHAPSLLEFLLVRELLDRSAEPLPGASSSKRRPRGLH